MSDSRPFAEKCTEYCEEAEEKLIGYDSGVFRDSGKKRAFNRTHTVLLTLISINHSVPVVQPKNISRYLWSVVVQETVPSYCEDGT